jgi:hypothetical protein
MVANASTVLSCNIPNKLRSKFPYYISQQAVYFFPGVMVRNQVSNPYKTKIKVIVLKSYL